MNHRGCILLISVTLCARLPTLGQSAAQATSLHSMAADEHPSFAVATIKPRDPNGRGGLAVAGDEVGFYSVSVLELITFAYSGNRAQLVGGPDWIREARYDIDGKADIEGKPNLAQQKEMAQKLLADRFQLKFHRGIREQPVYAIRVAKGGPKLAPAADPSGETEEDAAGHGVETTRTYTSASIAYFASMTQMLFFVDRPLVDQTGLTGRYDFKLRYTYDEAHATDPNAPPGLFTAVQEQLGLKLEPTKAPVEVFAIDSVERPGEN